MTTQSTQFPQVAHIGSPSSKAKAELVISDEAVIFSVHGHWYAQEPGEKDWKCCRNYPFHDGADNWFVDRVGGLPFDFSDTRAMVRIQ